jgi:hypothetical protein
VDCRWLPNSKLGTFTPARYDQAKQHGWSVISMKDDWKPLFVFLSLARSVAIVAK